MPVRILDESLINKIAAGEVVERPASVVKELVENAVDAGATQLTIYLRAGGRNLVRVVDNGIGMNRVDAMMCLERHATSKIKTEADLFAVNTLGFRGEAIPSIASVSRFTLLTRPADLEVGTRIHLEGGKLISVDPAGAPAGTDISAESLFFNVPARRKFLRAVDTELGHCTEAISREAMNRPEIDVEVLHDDRVLLRCTPVKSRRERAAALLGEHGRALVPIQFTRGSLTVDALVSPVGIHRSSMTGASWLYVNGRYVRDSLLRRAVTQAYAGIVPKDRYPVVVLSLQIPASEVDVNAHPAKVEVRFAHAFELAAAVTAGLRQGLIDNGVHRPVADEARYRPAEPAYEQQRLLAAEAETESLEVGTRPPQRGDPPPVGDGQPSDGGPPHAGASLGSPGVPSAGPGTLGEKRHEAGRSGDSRATAVREERDPAPAPAPYLRTPNAQRAPAGSEELTRSYDSGRAPVTRGPESSPVRVPDPEPWVKGLEPRRSPTQRGAGEAPSGATSGGLERARSDTTGEADAGGARARVEPTERGLSGRSADPSDHGRPSPAAPTQPQFQQPEAQSGPPRAARRPALAQQHLMSGPPVGRPLLPVRRFVDLRLIGQLAATYLLCEGGSSLVLIDQHAAHERVMLERLLRDPGAALGPAQRFLTPLLVELPAGLARLLAAHLDQLSTRGLELTHLGGGTVGVTALPAPLKNVDLPTLLADLAEDLAAGGSGVVAEKLTERTLATMACHGAVRAGQVLTVNEMLALLQQLDGVDFGVCAHGRPVAVVMNGSEIERRFHRT